MAETIILGYDGTQCSKAAPALARLAEARDANYTVVGTYGEKPLAGAILGATPHKLLPISPVPVVVVPAAE